ncbi:MAG: hypothetical protein JWP44_4874, partial [Mucilaginibacter sp.]|nr:hypothetical protein [Mucilaginibacter sp.]
RPAGAMSPHRARKWALLRTLRVLRESVRRGRAASLPNLLRFYRRSLAASSAEAKSGRVVAALERLYRNEQPFRATDWRRRRIEMLAEPSVRGR